MATIEIRMLGDFEIRVNGKPVLAVLGQSRKTTALVQYLVLQRGERVTHKVLTDTLWAGERSSNPDMALRAILHRFRNMIEAEGLDELRNCILTSRFYSQIRKGNMLVLMIDQLVCAKQVSNINCRSDIFVCALYKLKGCIH